MSYVGIITATEGCLLLGGVRSQTSSRFQSQEDCQAFVDVSIEINVKAGRPCTGDVITSSKKPELLHCSACHLPYDGRRKHRCESIPSGENRQE